MQSVVAGFTAEERDLTRSVVAGLNVAWKKVFKSNIRLFTIGVSTIGGTDVIASSGGVNSDWNKYTFDDDSSYLINLSYEQELNQPTVGIVTGKQS